jgi:hypothetical protein
VIAAVVAVEGAALWVQGQPLWCKCGSWVPWSFEINSRHNSQHFFDPYSLTHILHGVIFYGLLSLYPGRRVPVGWRAAMVAVIESGWELLENSPVIINRYRAATISLDYFGDSVINSMSDVVFCLLGFAIASRIPARASIALFVAIELGLLFWIRDNLTLNVIMLVHPIEAIRVWQSAM